MRPFVYTLFSLACIGIAGCQQEKPIPPEKVYPVKVASTIKKDIPIFIEYIGNVNTLQFVQIRPQVSGIITEAFVEEGQFVKKGDPLYQIDPRPYQAALDKAKATLIKDEAALQFSEDRVKRYTNLVKQEYFSKVNFDQYVSDVEGAKGQILSDKADIATAELNLEWTMPKSPIDGKISEFTIKPGNLVVAYDTTALTDIRQIDPADIWFSITQKDFIEVQKALLNGALKIEVFLPQEPNNKRMGKIYFVDNHIDLATGTILIKGTIPNEDGLFWPGEFIRVRLELKTQKNALLVPSQAVQTGQKGNFLYVYNPKNSTVSLRMIKKGETIDGLVQIESGINPGEQVVIEGQLNLKPDVKVSIVKEPNLKQSQPTQPAK